MFQGKGQTIVYSSQLDDGLLHHHPVAVLEGSGACHKEGPPAGTVPLPLPADPLPGFLPWLPQRHSSLSPVAWPLARRETLSASGGRGTKLLPLSDLTPRMHRSSNTSFPHRAQLHPQSPTRPQTTNAEGNERPRRRDQASARSETQASWEIPSLPARRAACRSRAPHGAPAQEEPLTRTPALSRGQSYLMSQLSLPRSAGR